jgi:AcrR family transcriptional regulator
VTTNVDANDGVRPADGRERLLATAVRHLETRGEAALRVTELASEAGVAIGLIRHHFGSRDGLVAAAQLRRVQGATGEDIAGARALLGDAADYETLIAGLSDISRRTIDRSRAAVRLSRFAAIATAHGRPAARETIGHALSGMLDEMAALIGEAQERGLVRTDLAPRAVATFIQAYALGMLISDLDPTPPDPDELLDAVLVGLSAILSPTGPTIPARVGTAGARDRGTA